MQGHILILLPGIPAIKFLGQLCHRAGLGDEPRRVLRELSELRGEVLSTRDGLEIRQSSETQSSDRPPKTNVLDHPGWATLHLAEKKRKCSGTTSVFGQADKGLTLTTGKVAQDLC